MVFEHDVEGHRELVFVCIGTAPRAFPIVSTYRTCVTMGATLAAQSGGTTKELMARLGHSTSKAALIISDGPTWDFVWGDRRWTAANWAQNWAHLGRRRGRKASWLRAPTRGHAGPVGHADFPSVFDRAVLTAGRRSVSLSYGHR